MKIQGMIHQEVPSLWTSYLFHWGWSILVDDAQKVLLEFQNAISTVKIFLLPLYLILPEIAL